MARVYEYKRSVNATTMENYFEESEFKLGDVICIKQEPCNTNNEDTCTTDNDGNTKYVSNKLSENDQTICGLITKESKDDVPDNMPKSVCDNENTVHYSNEKRNSKKRKRHERHSRRNRKNSKSKKALEESNGNFKSCKRQKEAVAKKSKQKDVHCKTCFLEFNSFLALRQHEQSYENRKQSFLSGGVPLGSGRVSCNFCSQMFKGKKPVQAHLFHLHPSDLAIDVGKNVLSNKPYDSCSLTPRKHIMRQTTLFEYMYSPKNPECSEITNNFNDSNVYSRAIIKQEIDLNDNDNDLSMNTLSVNTSLQNGIPNQTTTPNQPFVKIHVHSTTMKILLGIASNDSSEPSENDNKNNNNDKLYALRSLNNSKKLNNEKLSMACETGTVNSGEKLKNEHLLSTCKKCSVTLVKCDDKLLTKLTSQFNTPSTQVLGHNNSRSLKRKRQSRDRNVKITPTFDTPRNTIPKNSSSTDSTPKGFLNSSTPSKVTIHNFHVINNLSKQLAKQRSSHDQVAPNVDEKISSEKTNALDPKGLSSQEESERTNIQNIQPTTDLKLKELKVSLIKLPKIKKEFDTSNIVYCDICELPFSSEKRKDKHFRKFHTTYISSICMARYNSKRHMLKHYLQEHCVWACNRCCVCRKFCRSRLLLQEHLLLHCIKVILSKDEKCLNKIVKCNIMSKMHKRTTRLRPHSIKRKEIANIGQENLNANNVGYIESQVDKHKANNGAKAKITNYELQARQINEVCREMENSLENNIIFLSASNDYETMELAKEPVLDPLNINDSLISDNETQSTLTSNLKTVASNSSNDNMSISTLSNIGGNIKQRYPCSICGKRFTKLENLWQHKRTYTQSLQHFCKTCGLCFSNRKILRRHINSTHDFYLSKLYKYHCQFCNQGFRSENNLRIHELHYHATVETTDKQKVAELLQVSSVEKNPNTLETMCTICGINFNSYERYQLHCMYYHKGHLFACHFCDQIFQGLYMLHHHNKLHHYPESTRFSYKYHCPICYEGFTIETHFHGHMAHVHWNKQNDVPTNDASKSTKKSYICSKCHFGFSSIMELMGHVENYTDGGNYQCQQCQRKCCTLAVLNEHVNLSHGDSLRNDYKCDVCNEVLISSTSLLCHKKHVHQCLNVSDDFMSTNRTIDETVNETELNIHDKVLPETMGSENELVASFDPLIHMNTCTSSVKVLGKCNISCPICGIKFDTELYLKQHLIEYLDVGDYKCEKCQRRFANYEILRKHMANHTKPGMSLTKYYCSVCNENFQSSIVYESHVAHLHANIIVTDVLSSNV